MGSARKTRPRRRYDNHPWARLPEDLRAERDRLRAERERETGEPTPVLGRAWVGGATLDAQAIARPDGGDIAVTWSDGGDIAVTWARAGAVRAMNAARANRRRKRRARRRLAMWRVACAIRSLEAAVQAIEPTLRRIQALADHMRIARFARELEASRPDPTRYHSASDAIRPPSPKPRFL